MGHFLVVLRLETLVADVLDALCDNLVGGTQVNGKTSGYGIFFGRVVTKMGRFILGLLGGRKGGHAKVR
jgi:hypothetical protein